MDDSKLAADNLMLGKLMQLKVMLDEAHVPPRGAEMFQFPQDIDQFYLLKARAFRETDNNSPPRKPNRAERRRISKIQRKNCTKN